jgi:hypothetical protein
MRDVTYDGGQERGGWLFVSISGDQITVEVACLVERGEFDPLYRRDQVTLPSDELEY